MVNILRIKGCTRTLGQSQGYLGLPIRDEVMFDPAMKKQVPCMISAWELMPSEIIALTEGHPLMLRLLGSSHPPVAMYIGDDYSDKKPFKKPTGDLCPVCGNMTYHTPAGIVCDNGHGGVA